jgi:vancomycin resistance protein YoaR
VRITTVPPERTTAQARAMRITELVSEFSTPYACCQPRVTNIKRGAAIMDGTIIPEGGTFSLNEVLGERTSARGFVAAPQINAGRLEDAVGGGVSQIATTMFNAAFFAGLNLVSHTPHEFWITRYPPGREATVSWGGPELIVENDWPAAVLVKATATDEGITIRLYSSKLGRRVTTTTSDNAVAGTAFTSTYTRKVFRNDQLLRDERWTWSYKAPPPD